MRKIFTTLSLLTLSLLLHAQNLTLNTHTVHLDFGEQIEKGDVTINNFSSNELELAVRIESTCYVNGDATALDLCINQYCFQNINHTVTLGIQGGPLITLAPNETFENLIELTPQSYSTIGSEWRVVFFDRNNPDNSVDLNVFLEECNAVVSTSEVTNELGSAYPNPANNTINIPYQLDNAKGQLRILNLLGGLMESIDLNQSEGLAQIDINQYPSGFYLYYISLGESKQTRTFKFTKS